MKMDQTQEVKSQAEVFFANVDQIAREGASAQDEIPAVRHAPLAMPRRQATASGAEMLGGGEFIPSGSPDAHLGANLKGLGIWSQAVFYMASQRAKREAAVAIATDLIRAGREVAFQKIALATDLEKNKTALAYFAAKPELAAKLSSVSAQAHAEIARCLYDSRDFVYGERASRAAALARRKVEGTLAEEDYRREIEVLNALSNEQLERAMRVLRDIWDEFGAHLALTLRVLTCEPGKLPHA
jgi:hypothetical protein